MYTHIQHSVGRGHAKSLISLGALPASSTVPGHPGLPGSRYNSPPFIAHSRSHYAPLRRYARDIARLAGLFARCRTIGDGLSSVVAVGSTLRSVVAVGSTLRSVVTVGSTLRSVVTVGGTLSSVVTVGAALRSVVTVGAALRSAVTVGATLRSVVTVGAALRSVVTVGSILRRQCRIPRVPNLPFFDTVCFFSSYRKVHLSCEIKLPLHKCKQ